ncbi:hypothetical protein [uncultured Photobacterium sp.]|uniref:hypothetical protein n=1 Tax=uncultured Photobacterium sp. TaxID=173973 RepID=UPI00261319AD|nr:hypothetical protein [uncultured Photobacterium sp.]
MRFKSVLFGLMFPIAVMANPPSPLSNMPKVSDRYELNIDKLIMLELEDGTFMLATGDGKFVIRNATLFSTLKAANINSVAELKRADQTTMHEIGIEPETDLTGYELNPMASQYGGTLFASPSCASCKTLIDTLVTKHRDKRFKVVVAPILSEGEFRETILANCAADPGKALQAVMAGQWSKHRFPPTSRDNCQAAAKAINLNIAALQMLINDRMGVPALINNDGARMMGLPSSDTALEIFIKGSRKNEG